MLSGQGLSQSELEAALTEEYAPEPKENGLDSVFIDLVDSINNNKKVVFSIGHNTTFLRHGDTLTVRYEPEVGRIVEHQLKDIEQLVEGDTPFESSDQDWMDKYIPLLMAIETAIDAAYRNDPDLKDKMILAIVDRLVAKPDIRINSVLLNDIQANIRLILSTIRYSRKEVIGSLRKVQKSIKRHHSVNGPTGYLDFIKESLAKVKDRRI
jgi:hypothetical protein